MKSLSNDASQEALSVPSGDGSKHLHAVPAEHRKAITIVKSNAEANGAGWTIAGMAVGMALGGPVGAAVGGWVGNAISKNEPQGARTFSLDEVAGADFPPGHPEIDTTYLRHPLDPQRYIPVTDYSATIFAEKRRELKALLQALGARTLRISTLDERRQRSSARLGLSAPTHAGQFGVAAAHQQRTASTDTTREIIRSNPTRDPHVPAGLLWYEHEADWQSLASGRLQLGTQTVTCKVTRQSLKEISGSLNLGLESLGLALGGDSNEEMAETVEFHADFRERRVPLGRAWVAGLALALALAVAAILWMSR